MTDAIRSWTRSVCIQLTGHSWFRQTEYGITELCNAMQRSANKNAIARYEVLAKLLHIAIN